MSQTSCSRDAAYLRERVQCYERAAHGEAALPFATSVIDHDLYLALRDVMAELLAIAETVEALAGTQQHAPDHAPVHAGQDALKISS
jgi:hypothetical protein